MKDTTSQARDVRYCHACLERKPGLLDTLEEGAMRGRHICDACRAMFDAIRISQLLNNTPGVKVRS